MAVNFKYWDDCVDPQDMEAMWMDPEVLTEWINAGETRDQKVHLSRDPDGQPYLTQIEMKAVARIIVRRHFVSQIDSDMIRAIAELESDRQPLSTRYNKTTKETTMGIMQILPKTADWLVSELGYRTYKVEGNSELLHMPFVNVYLGAAYIRWLSNYDQKGRSEEFIVRAYKGGTKEATHKSTLPYWRRYLSVKESLPSRNAFEVGLLLNGPSTCSTPVSRTTGAGGGSTTWDSRASPEDMGKMWNHPNVSKEWTKAGEKRGKVRFSHDAGMRPYLSRVEMRAIAEIILSKHFSTREVKPAVPCALAEIVSMRLVNGVGPRIGIMGIEYPTACWLYKDLGYKAYKVESVEDLMKPFVSMYFGAAYLVSLSEHEGRERTPEFVVKAYIAGPKNVSVQEKDPLWCKFEEAVTHYEEVKKEQGSCTIL
uniref:Transglycosylase SLT domain-containing protein n=1 Tax=Davidia involucrata TaxID=16924 RepID=A0A5B6YRF4_DAVIN